MRAVALPVTLSVLIVLVAFLPGLYLPGWAGQMMRPICLIMILTLVFSLVEALLILPSHLVAPVQAPTAGNALHRLRTRLNGGLDRCVERVYRPLLALALRWRYLTVALFAALLIICWGLVASDRVRQSINPDVSKDSFWVSIRLPQSAPYSETKALATRVENALFELRDELDGVPPGAGKRGHDPEHSVIVGVETIVWEHGAGLWLELSAAGRQRIKVEDFIRDWRKRIGEINLGQVDFIFKEGDEPYDLELTVGADNPAQLGPAVEQLKQQIKAFAAPMT